MSYFVGDSVRDKNSRDDVMMRSLLRGALRIVGIDVLDEARDGKQESVGFAEAGVNTQLLQVSRSYEDWLPAANVALEITPDVLVRLAASRVMTRPPLAQLTPGDSIKLGDAAAVGSAQSALAS